MSEDYAVVGEPAENVSQEIFAYDNETKHEWAEDIKTHHDWLSRLDFWSGCYGFSTPGKLIYADVDDKDPSHQQEVYGKLAKEPDLAEETKEAATAAKELVDFLNAGLDSEDQSPALFVEAMRAGELEPEIVDYLLQVKDKEGTQMLLNVLSRQSKRKTPRPVMILVGMIDKAQTDKRGLTEGWAIGYDFLKGFLIIKSFCSKKDQHPLGETWYGNVSDDGISFKGTPAVFAQNFVNLGNQIGSSTGNNGLGLLVHTFVANWILRQWKGLSNVEPNVWTKEFKKSIKDAKKKIEAILEGLTVAVKEKTGEPKLPMDAFEALEKKLTNEDGFFRLSALEAREKGNKEAAQNAAVFYERLVKDLKSFNENPENQY